MEVLIEIFGGVEIKFHGIAFFRNVFLLIIQFSNYQGMAILFKKLLLVKDYYRLNN